MLLQGFAGQYLSEPIPCFAILLPNLMRYITENLHTTPLVGNAALPGRGIQVEQIHLEAGALPAQYHAHHLLMLYQANGPYVVRHRGGPRVGEVVYHTGDLSLYPGGECHASIDWATPSDNIYLTVEKQYLERLVSPDLDLTQVTLCERWKFHDPLLGQLSRQLLAAAGSRHALGVLYAESLTAALGYHLLEHHATSQPRHRGERRLTGPVLARIDAYLEAHPEAPVTLEALADLANLSVFHFARLFKQATGMSPYQYVLRWKMQRARQLLRRNGASVAAISDALGFASVVTFVAAFKRAVGCTPQQFQRR